MADPTRVRDHREPGHFWADNEIADEYLPEIGVYGFAVYMLLARYADAKTGQCDPSVGGIAKSLDIAVPTVRKALDKLRDTGLITIRHRRKERDGKLIHQTSIYTILAIKKQQKALPTKPDLLGNEIDQGVLNQVDQGTKGDYPGVLNQVSSNKTHKNKKESSSSEAAAHVGYLLDQNMGAASEFADLDPDIAIRDFDNRRKAGQSPGHIVRAWRLKRPTADSYFGKPVPNGTGPPGYRPPADALTRSSLVRPFVRHSPARRSCRRQ